MTHSKPHRFAVLTALAMIAVVVVTAAVSCERGHLRGRADKSVDGKTYLVIDDDNGGQACEFFVVDGKRWPHALHTPGEIAPGAHTIDCGGEIGFEIPAGTTFFFNYWGP